jgi:hypothetical protein
MDSIWTIGFPTVNTFIGIGQDPKDPSNAKGVVLASAKLY